MSPTLKSTRACAVATGLALLVSSVALGESYDSYAGAVGAVESELGQSQQQLERNRQRKAAVSESLATIAPRTELARERLHKNARALYRVSRGGMLPVAGGMAALLGHASRVSRLEQIVHRDLASVQKLGAESLALRKEAGALESEISSQERQLSALELARAGAVRERVTHGSFESTFNAGVAAAPRSEGRAQYGLSVVGGTPSERFTEQRGNLALPVSGPSSIQDATRAESDGPGLEFAAHAGAAVRAGASGRVAFAESYGSYGKLVIIEHGDRYYTVYGGLAQLDVRVGDDLSKSARLGSAGSEAVYFEVRRGTKTQDARLWLGL